MRPDFKEEWLHKGPPLDEIVSESRDDRRGGRRRLAIIIPSYRNGTALKAHLERLSKQTCKDFDVIIIYGEDDEPVDMPPDFSILHLKRNFDFGSAGAFYAGERRAFQDGYEIIVLADDDCLPESPELLEQLAGGLESSEVVKPTVVDASPKPRADVIAQYGAMRREVFAKAGFSFLPLYTGAEDVLLERSIREAGFGTSRRIGAIASHPVGPTFLLWPWYKVHYYFRNTGLYFALLDEFVLLNLTVFCQLILILGSFSIGRTEVGMGLLRTLSSICCANYFRETGVERGGRIARAEERVEEGVIPAISKKPELVEMDIRYGFLAPMRRGKVSGTFWSAMAAYAKDLGGQVAALPGNFGRKIIILGSNNDLELLALLFCSSGWLTDKGRAYSIIRGRGRAGIALGALFFAAMLPLALGLTPLLSFIAVASQRVRGIDGTGYGI